jgi:histone-lysine N-methyltransferase ASH1L
MSKLFGHGKRRAKGDDIKTKTMPKRRRSAGDALASNAAAGFSTENVANGLVGDAAINAFNLDVSVGAPNTLQGAEIAKKNKPDADEEIKQEPVTRRVTRLSGTPVPNAVTGALLSIGRRGKKTVEDGLSRVSRELKQLQDTKEFAHIDDRPILETVWSNGKFVDPRTLNEPVLETRASKRVKTSHNAEPEEPVKAEEPAANALLPAVPELPERKRTAKNWLEKGLYAGQPTPADLSVCLTKVEKKRLAQYPELSTVWKPNKTLPPPMFNGLRLLIQGRDFKLPYDICNPLPPGQPKPAAYRTMTRSKSSSPISTMLYANDTCQIASSATRPRTGRSSRTCRTSSPSASASPRTAAPRTARTASCCTSATTPTAT